MKNLFLVLGMMLMSTVAVAGHGDYIRLNTFLTEAFPGEGNERTFSGFNHKDQSCEIRFILNDYLHIDSGEKTVAAGLYEVKVKKIDNLKHIKFSKKNVEVDILNIEGGYLFVITEREGLFRKISLRTSCFITL